MRIIALLIFVCLFSGCNKRDDVDDRSRTISVKACQELSPSDLGIQKERFVAFPKPEEVAIFRSSKRSQLVPNQNQTYDQIYWTNGGQAEEDVMIAPLSFYLGYPAEPEDNSREQLFRDSWRLQAGGYGFDIKEYAFVRSDWSSSAERAIGRVVYTKNHVTNSEDLVFQFEMFVLPISEAKRLHPALEEKIEKGTSSWKAAFPLNEEAEQIAAPNGP